MTEKMKLTDEQAWALAEDIEKRFGELPGKGKSPLMHGRVGWRRAHYHNLPEVDPPLPAHMAGAQRFQSDRPRAVHSKLKARLTENQFVVRVAVRDTATERRKASRIETVTNEGLALVEERRGIRIQEELANGQIIDGYGVLHWCKSDHLWPRVPDPKVRDDLPEDRDDAEGYEPHPDDEGKPTRRYQEKSARLLARYAQEKAEAGFPFHVGFPDAIGFSFMEDVSLENGLGVVVVTSRIPLSRYLEMLKADKPGNEDARAPSEIDKDVPIHGEVAAPWEWEPNASEWGETVIVRQLWTRDECYELVEGVGSSTRTRKTVKAFGHPYKMPPFALATALIAPGADPVQRYLPALEGVFRVKPVLDRAETYLMALAEQIATPYYYYRQIKGGEAYTDESGNKMTFRRDSALAERAPEGYELAKVEFEINPSYVEAVRWLRQEMADAEPDTGQAEVTASTQSWAIRLQQAQASVELGMYLNSAARAINTMARNMIYVMGLSAEDGGFGTPVTVYQRRRKGRALTRELISVAPEDVITLDVETTISGVSSAERITLVEHGRTLLNDAKVPLTVTKFLEEYMGEEDPDEVIAAYDAERIFEYVKTGLIQQKVAERYGTKVVMGPNGEFVGSQGQPLSPADVLQQNGQQPSPSPMNGMQVMGGQTTIPNLPGLETAAVPNVMGLPGMVG